MGAELAAMAPLTVEPGFVFNFANSSFERNSLLCKIKKEQLLAEKKQTSALTKSASDSVN